MGDIRDPGIRGRERLRVGDLTKSSFLVFSNFQVDGSFILPFFTKKVSTVIFNEAGYALSGSDPDKTSNI